jgi:hypothetical protein
MTELTTFGAAFLLVTVAMVAVSPTALGRPAAASRDVLHAPQPGLGDGPFNFFSIRLLLLAGIIRIFCVAKASPVASAGSTADGSLGPRGDVHEPVQG